MRHRIMRLKIFWSLAFFGLTLSPLVHAGTSFGERCVGTVAELDSALIAAQSSVDNMLVKFKTGTWNVGNSQLRLNRLYKVLRLEGGYNSDCSARTINASNTILDFDGQIMLGLRTNYFSMEGFRVIDLNPNSEFKLSLTNAFANATLEIRNNEIIGHRFFVNCTESNDGVFALVANNRVSNSLSNGLELDFSVCDTDNGLIQIYNNTVANNSGRGIVITTELDQSDFRLANNIAWGHGLQDIFLTTTGVPSTATSAKFYQNTYATKIGLEGSGSTGTLNSNPQFINAAGGNFQIQTSSSAVNSGSSAYVIGNVDALGRTRVIGSQPDRGAYETGVDDAITATQIVTNTNDSGAGSLRQAIVNANASTDFTFIDFDIPGTCFRTITLASNLPNITSGLRINGFTQPGSAANTRATGDNATRCILLVGVTGTLNGFQFTGNTASQFWLQGIVFSNFDTALLLNGGVNNLVQGNQFGGRLGSIANLADSNNNIILGSFSDASSIGGDAPAQRNVLAGGIFSITINSGSFLDSNDNQIINNLIGTSGLEVDDFGSNNHSIVVETTRNTIRNNVIVNSGRNAILLTGASNNLIQNNRIGRKDPYCTLIAPSCIDINAGSGWHGIAITEDSANNQIVGNSVWNGVLGGVVISSGLSNKVSRNSIYQNGDSGIVLGGYNGTDNDALPATANFANRGLNYPVIQSAAGSSSSGTITGVLSTSNGSYRVEVFSSALADTAARGEGEIYHGGTTVTINNGLVGAGNGFANFSVSVGSLFSGSNFSGRHFVATATDANGNTSEFSPRVIYSACDGFRNGFESLATPCGAP